MRVFVTGHRGYIGAHLVDLLKLFGHTVTGCDLRLYDGCELGALAPADVELVQDVREVREADLAGHDAVCHLAAISNDPMGDLNPEITFEVNRDASIALAQRAKAAGVGRFVFAGSCSIYGRGAKLDLNETDRLKPLTAYAKTKILAEEGIGHLAGPGFCPVYLRNATAYGFSPMLRTDLVVNNLLGSALAYGQIRVKSDGRPWRPLIHCRDIARAMLAFCQAPAGRVCNQAVNVGANHQNFQVKTVVRQVQRLVPQAAVAFTGEVGEDPRNYRVNFDKLGRLLPEFRLHYDLETGLEELHRKLCDFGFGIDHFESDRFTRLRTLKKRIGCLKSRAA